MPLGLLVTIPLPLIDTVRVKLFGIGVYVAVADWFCVTVRLHVVPVPKGLHAPPQPAKLKPVCGAAWRVTGAFTGYEFPQVPGQLIPPSALVTIPLPLLLVIDTDNR